MAYLIEPAPAWADIFQIDVDTPVLGGPTGPANYQALALMQRTSYLKGRADTSDAAIAANTTGLSRLSGSNWLINGGFNVWQRGTSLASGSGIRYLADRWTSTSNGSTNVPSRQSFSPGQGIVAGEPAYYLRCAVTSVANASNYSVLQQRIEDVRSLAGQQAVLSFWAKADSAKNIAVEFEQYFGAGGSPSAGVTGIGVTTIALTTAWNYFTVPVTIPNISGKTLGTTDPGFLGVNFWMEAGSASNSRCNSLGQRSGTFDFANIKLEKGATPTPAVIPPYGEELVRCKRYFEVVDGAKCLGITYTLNGGTRALLPFTVEKRVVPTLTQSGSLNVIGAGSAASVLDKDLGTITLSATTRAARIDMISGYANIAAGGDVVSWGDNGVGAFKVFADSEIM